ncbi:hypothetical protein H2199_004530 [Coniosporium tulheliwenetii]|uniref:Uncharacterized protein n=1 Tax=Coniosporium tulheliwenetii TaxID=3383036 RepID=A0ACC2Z738_9PEZI|nr:hypothetical protein H2199_004530 [Cladosporium sp. JES 115]
MLRQTTLDFTMQTRYPSMFQLQAREVVPQRSSTCLRQHIKAHYGTTAEPPLGTDKSKFVTLNLVWEGQCSDAPYFQTTLNATTEYSNSEDDGTSYHRINQYTIKQEIGRGSFGAVHLAVDQYNQEYEADGKCCAGRQGVLEVAVAQTRAVESAQETGRQKRAGHLAAGIGFNSPLMRSGSDSNNSLDLIKEEIAIMKKLNHPNLVSLIEVLDDPDEDSLYMVLEMCKKGVVMKVGLDDPADPYDEEQCRCWFRDMILGIEYRESFSQHLAFPTMLLTSNLVHAQGIIHRDIKPDNCLITEDDMLKIVDFGVSEMFEKESDMNTAKSAGSPAFMPPELCVAKHGHVSGKAADIWSMGVTLYCLRFGKLPFQKTGMLALYESIREDKLDIPSDCSDDLRDLFSRVLEKDAQKRIHMNELREHPWVTKRGTDPLPSKEENIAVLVDPPTEEELNAAITGNMGHLMAVMKAVKRFKQLIFKKRPDLMQGILGSASRIVQPPLSMRSYNVHRRSRSFDTDDRRAVESALVREGVHREIPISDDLIRQPEELNKKAIFSEDNTSHESNRSSKQTEVSSRSEHKSPEAEPVPAAERHLRRETRKGQAHDPLEDTLFLDIHAPESVSDDTTVDPERPHIVLESPAAADVNVYEQAYQEEIDKILKAKGERATLYLTRRVEGNKEISGNEHLIGGTQDDAETPKSGLAKLLQKAKAKTEAREQATETTDGTEESRDDAGTKQEDEGGL